jgi:hypothetical protein
MNFRNMEIGIFKYTLDIECLSKKIPFSSPRSDIAVMSLICQGIWR